jgi:hypothetical protein
MAHPRPLQTIRYNLPMNFSELEQKRIRAEIEAAGILRLQDEIHRLDRKRIVLQRRLYMRNAEFIRRYVKQTASSTLRLRAIEAKRARVKPLRARQSRGPRPTLLMTIKQLRERHGCTWKDAVRMRHTLQQILAVRKRKFSS